MPIFQRPRCLFRTKHAFFRLKHTAMPRLSLRPGSLLNACPRWENTQQRFSQINWLRLALLVLIAALLLPAWHLKHPLLYKFSMIETPFLLGLPILLLYRCSHWLGALGRWLLITLFVLTLWGEIEYRLQRSAVLAASPAMQAVGAHIMVGYDNFAEVQELARKGLIGGVYIARRNIRGRSFADVANEIATLQSARKAAGLPPLVVAADQEGGCVSHLTPILPAMPPLAALSHEPDPESAARAYGQQQGKGLAALGITLNFGPVVDLKPDGRPEEDIFSNIPARSIASDPHTVIRIARGYLAGLNDAGEQGTLKHFPGLGRVKSDTHLHPATLLAAPESFAADWLPFQTLSQQGLPAIMLGHVTLAALDPEHAASHSAIIIRDLLRRQWGFQGRLITDDLNMGAVYDRGIGQVTREAIAAGVDLVLISYDPRQVYRAIFEASRT